MSQTQEWNDFSAGWIPSDDAFSGRKTGLLQMDNVELDKNGALSLIGGTSTLGSAYPANAHTLFSAYLGGTRFDYLADVAGGVYRNGGSPIITGGDSSNAGFGRAYDYALIASGSQRKKDTGAALVNLGIGKPTVPPLVTVPIQSINVTPPLLAKNSGADGIQNTLKSTATTFAITSISVTVNPDNNGNPGTATITFSAPLPANFLALYGPHTDSNGNFVPGSAGVISGNSFINGSLSFNFLDQVSGAVLTKVGGFPATAAGTGSGGLLTLQSQGGNTLFNGDPLVSIFAVGDVSVQTNVVAGTPLDFSTLKDFNPTTGLFIATGFDPIAHIFLTSNLHNQKDDDLFAANLKFTNGVASDIISFTMDFLLVQPAADGLEVSDFYRGVFTGDTSSNAKSLQVRITRGEFVRIGVKNLDWRNVYGFRLTVSTTNLPTYIISFPFVSGATDPVGPCFQSGLNSVAVLNTAVPTGVDNPYEWVQVNVNHNGYYIGKSPISPQSKFVSLSRQNPLITPQDPTGIDPQINEIWIFRRGGSLAKWYRVFVRTALDVSAGLVPWNTPFIDNFVDFDAQDLNITVNPKLVSIASSDIPDKIYEILGPIEGRWLYFTKNFMYPSDINDPDLVDAELAVRTINGSSEQLMWARKVGDALVAVGTSVDVYLLSGTFQTLPDFSIDLYYRGLGSKFPPISYDCTHTVGVVYYMSNDGWRSISFLGSIVTPGLQNPLIVVPNTDRLYRGITAYGYSIQIQNLVPGAKRFPVLYARNKLWCGIPGQGRVEVLDTTRGYWRNFAIQKGDVTAFCDTQDGQILAFFAGDKRLRTLDVQTSLLIDGSGKQQVNLLSPVFDGGTKRQRKDLYTLKALAATGGDNLGVWILTDDNSVNFLGNLNSVQETDSFLDISQVVAISKWFQIKLSGLLSAFSLANLTVDYDLRPIPLTFVRGYTNNFGNASKKRVRVWPFMIDTRGSDVVFTPNVDLVPYTPTVINTTDKKTVRFFFKTDVFGVDYGYTFSGLNLFELWEPMAPDIVQTLPIARQFDQVGPEELFRYGRIKQFELRVLPFGTSIPWKIYFNDNSVETGLIACINGLEQSFMIGTSMRSGGQIVRIELGPTNFDFHRFYMRLLVSKTGRDSEREWVTLPDPQADQGA